MEEIGIESSLVEEIRKGRKTVEIELGKPRFLKFKEGDEISIREDMYLNGEIIDSFSNSIIIKISQILYFENFKEMLDSIDYKSIIPSAKSADQVVKKLRTFYSVADEIEFGVVALMIEI